MATKTGHAVFHIKREAQTRQLAIVWDINARFTLFLQDESQIVPDLRLKARFIQRIALLFIEQHTHQRFAARQAASVGGKNAVLTRSHKILCSMWRSLASHL